MPGPDLKVFPSNCRAHGVYKSSSPSVPRADQAQASLPTDILQDQQSTILPGRSYPLCSEPYLDAYQCPGAAFSQFVGVAWHAPYPPDPNVFQGHLLSPYVEGYVDYPEGHVTHSGFNPYDISNGDWSCLDDSHRIQETYPPYHDEFYRDRLGINHSTHQTQELMALTHIQGLGCVTRKSPHLLQARLQKLENTDPKAPAGNSPAHQAEGLHGIPSLPPIEFYTDQPPLPLQSSGHTGSSQVVPTHSRGSCPENPSVDWNKGSATT